MIEFLYIAKLFLISIKAGVIVWLILGAVPKEWSSLTIKDKLKTILPGFFKKTAEQPASFRTYITKWKVFISIVYL